MGHKVPQSQYFHGLWHSFFFSTVKDGIITYYPTCFNIYLKSFPVKKGNLFRKGEISLYLLSDVFTYFPEISLLLSVCFSISKNIRKQTRESTLIAKHLQVPASNLLQACPQPVGSMPATGRKHGSDLLRAKASSTRLSSLTKIHTRNHFFA